jgi:hypothetical protein
MMKIGSTSTGRAEMPLGLKKFGHGFHPRSVNNRRRGKKQIPVISSRSGLRC